MTRGKEASSIVRPLLISNARRTPALCLVATLMLCAMEWRQEARGEVFLPRPMGDPAIAISATAATKWQDGEYEVWHLSGGCALAQGDNLVEAGEAIVWIDAPEPDSPDQTHKVLVYAEPHAGTTVTLKHRGAEGTPARQTVPVWFGRWITGPGVAWNVPKQSPAPAAAPTIYARGTAYLQSSAQQALVANTSTPIAGSGIEQVQFQQFMEPQVAAPSPAVSNPMGVRSVQVIPRNGVANQYVFKKLPNGESALTISGGVQIVIEGLQAPGIPAELGSVDLLDIQADRIVAWSAGSLLVGSFQQRNDVPLEIYMEGNIVFRQGDRTVYADRMYYDVRRNVGTIINAELLTPMSNLKGVDYEGLVRLKAGVIEQLDASRFVAHDALLTASRLEVPSFHLASDTITFENSQRPKMDPYTGMQARNPVTLEPEYESTSFAQSRGNLVYLSNFPVFYWPTLATDLEKPSYYISNLRARNDRIYGFQTLVDLDVWQVFGVSEKPAGVDWDLSLDYLNKRGFGYGTTIEYSRDSFFNLAGRTNGMLDAWFINDKGVDNLGFGRRNITPEKSSRGRIFWNHRQTLVDGWFEGWTAQAEVGWISDRTFLEQYYEQEWDERKDQITGVRMKKVRDNWSLDIEANGQLNDFVTQTQWLPRFDSYLLGQDLANESVTWSSHTSLAYANQNIASTPTNATLAGQFALLPWEQDSAGNRADPKGERLITRNQLAMPLNLEPFKVVPYAIGELGHWGSDIEGNDIQRAYFQTGLRASIPFWTANPTIQDPVFNLNGLAHKVVFDMEASYSDSNRDVTDFPLYDELDDDVFDDIRRRLFNPTFGGQLAGTYYNSGVSPTTIDPKFDPRYYLLRNNTQGLVTSPAMEVVDDLSLVRFGMRHRLQTKRGAPGREHIVDWITFDSNITWFPESDRDNYGSSFGLADYDLRWHLGDRFTLLSDGAADFFGDGLRTISAGMMMNRPSRGNMYLGYRTLRGPFTADVVTATVNYRMNAKWVASASAVVDFSEAGNIGQSITFSRIGESLIVSVGANIDESKDNVGFNLLVEPRFLPSLNLTKTTGIDIPPVGAGGLE